MPEDFEKPPQVPEHAQPVPIDTGKIHGPELPNLQDYMEVHRRATHDSLLSDLLNQGAMREAVADRVKLAEGGRARPAFFMFDVDKFKEEVNDKYGHEAGDQLLRGIAEMLKTTLRSEGGILPDLAARLGGDEFGILIDLTPRSGDEQAPWHILEVIERRIEEKIQKLFEQEQFTHHKDRGVDISFGSSIWRPGMSAQEFMKQADDELYKVKQAKGASR